MLDKNLQRILESSTLDDASVDAYLRHWMETGSSCIDEFMRGLSAWEAAHSGALRLVVQSLRDGSVALYSKSAMIAVRGDTLGDAARRLALELEMTFGRPYSAIEIHQAIIEAAVGAGVIRSQETPIRN